MKIAKKYREELVWAIYYGQLKKVKRLISSGTDVNESDEGGRRAIHYVKQEGGLDTIQLLLSVDGRINEKDKNGYSPLYQAAADVI